MAPTAPIAATIELIHVIISSIYFFNFLDNFFFNTIMSIICCFLSIFIGITPSSSIAFDSSCSVCNSSLLCFLSIAIGIKIAAKAARSAAMVPIKEINPAYSFKKLIFFS